VLRATGTSDVPGPFALAAFAAVALAVSAVFLVHQERAYEHDPVLRARAGLVDARSDISLMRTENFAQALTAIGERAGPGGLVSTLSVTPVRVAATITGADGAQTDVTVTPGLRVETRVTGNRVGARRGLRTAEIPAGAPARILLGAQQRFGLRDTEFERLELSGRGWQATWSQPIDDDGLVAALDGSGLRRP
jgi:hypothetical protein